MNRMFGGRRFTCRAREPEQGSKIFMTAKNCAPSSLDLHTVLPRIRSPSVLPQRPEEKFSTPRRRLIFGTIRVRGTSSTFSAPDGAPACTPVLGKALPLTKRSASSHRQAHALPACRKCWHRQSLRSAIGTSQLPPLAVLRRIWQRTRQLMPFARCERCCRNS